MASTDIVSNFSSQYFITPSLKLFLTPRVPAAGPGGFLVTMM
jgi:hypothetical protein